MALNNVIAGKTAVTAKMALRFGRLFGNGPEIWLNLQRDYDIWHDGQKMKDESRGYRADPGCRCLITPNVTPSRILISVVQTK